MINESDVSNLVDDLGNCVKLSPSGTQNILGQINIVGPSGSDGIFTVAPADNVKNAVIYLGATGLRNWQIGTWRGTDSLVIGDCTVGKFMTLTGGSGNAYFPAQTDVAGKLVAQTILEVGGETVLHGGITIQGGGPADHKVLTADGNGVGTWKYPWESLDSSHIPNLDADRITTGTFHVARLGTTITGTSLDDPNNFLRGDGVWEKPPQGTVNAFTSDGLAPVTATISGGVATFSSKVVYPNLVLAGPSSGSTAEKAEFRALVPADLNMGELVTTLNDYFYTRTQIDANDPGVSYDKSYIDYQYCNRSDVDNLIACLPAPMDSGTVASMISTALGAYGGVSDMDLAISNIPAPLTITQVMEYLNANFEMVPK